MAGTRTAHQVTFFLDEVADLAPVSSGASKTHVTEAKSYADGLGSLINLDKSNYTLYTDDKKRDIEIYKFV